MASPVFWSVVGGITALKILLIPSYKSTDFEVHRNWLAITHSLPLEQWYYEERSEWTLDYPPFFAWFEYILSFVGKYFDSAMLSIYNQKYDSEMTVLFQRLSVIVADLVFAYGVKECCSCIGPPSWQSKKDIWVHNGFILSIMLFGNAGLILVDHIHFQYNGFLFGFLLISIAKMLQDKHLQAAFWFAVLLNLKHIYLYIAPAYFIYLLRSYCFLYSNRDGGVIWRSFSVKNFLKLSVTVITVFAASFGPFIIKGQLQQIISRLFPFKRGLTHAYWAPNIWAVYNVVDKVLFVGAKQLGFVGADSIGSASMTGGLVKEYKHAILPNITPLIAFIFSVLSCLPAVVKLWQKPNKPWDFVRCLVLCAYGTYMFGWHVHEKAILLVIIPLTLLATIDWDDANVYLLTSITGHFSLFPLFFTPAETPSKILLLVMHGIYSVFGLCLIYKDTVRESLLSTIEKIYFSGFLGVQLYHSHVHKWLGHDQTFPFAPLLLFSVYCSFGLIYSWLKFYKLTLGRSLTPWKKYS